MRQIMQVVIMAFNHCNFLSIELRTFEVELFIFLDPDYNCSSKASFNLNDRVCSIVIERLSDSMVRKYCGDKIQTEVNTKRSYRSTCQSNRKVHNSITNNEENIVIESTVHKNVIGCENSSMFSV